MHGHRPAGTRFRPTRQEATIFIRAKPLFRSVIEILLTLLILLGLAKRKGRGKYRRYIRGAIQHDLDLGTLGANVLTSENLSSTITEQSWLSSVKATWSLSDFTNAVGDGPILVGVAHSDYSSAEIEAWVENTGSWDFGNKIQQEIGRRKIRQVGSFLSSVADSQGIAVLNEGRPITTKCGWLLQTGQTVKIWAYNQGDSALATTDPDLSVVGHANLWPN